MNPIQKMARDLRKRLPGATVALDPPATPAGSWWLDASLNRRKVVVEWRPTRGFGVSTPTGDDFGEGPHEIYADAAETLDRATALLSSDEHTQAPRELVLKSLRKERRLSQDQLAKLLKVRQASISKLERRADVRISTLRSIVAGMGGKLELRAVFPDNVIRIVQFKDSQQSPRKARTKNRRPNKR